MNDGENIIFYLTRRLSDTPKIFYRKPSFEKKSFSNRDNIFIKPILNDLVFNLTGNFLPSDKFNFFVSNNFSDNYFSLLGLIYYLINDDFFRDKNITVDSLFNIATDKNIVKLSELVDFKNFITDGERREEMVRLVLSKLNIIPEGETRNYFFDRLSTLDSVERYYVIEKGKEARERAQKIRLEIERKKMEEEAASKMTRE